MAGTNLSVVKGPRGKGMVLKALNGGLGGNTRADGNRPGGYRKPVVFQKVSATAPTTDTAADAPEGVGDFCLHFSAAAVFQDLYRCTAYVSDSSFTWTKVVE